MEQQLDTSPGAETYEGRIVNIVEIEKGGSWMASLGGAVVGATVGSQIGGGTGKSIATSAGAVGGGAAGRELSKDVAFRLTLRTDAGRQFQCVVMGDGFIFDDEVVFTVRKGKVTSIAHKAVIESRERS
jgi:outer membrane lipoprotein SlyB